MKGKNCGKRKERKVWSLVRVAVVARATGGWFIYMREERRERRERKKRGDLGWLEGKEV